MMMTGFSTSAAWREKYSNACIGILALCDVHNPQHSPNLEQNKHQLEDRLRTRYGAMDRSELKAHPTLLAYAVYYKAFKKTYHVQLQLESIVFKGKSIPKVAALVEAMFMAELKNLLLTAGHDLDLIEGMLTVDVAHGDEIYIKLNGQEQILKTGDMYIRDDLGVLSSIIYGPAQRTSITSDTKSALFTVYGPPGIGMEDIRSHLEDLVSNVRLIAPEARIQTLEVLSTG